MSYVTKKSMNRDCVQCGAAYTVANSKSVNQKYCSPACGYIFKRNEAGKLHGVGRGNASTRPKRAFFEKDCQYCGEKFLHDKFHPHRLYCSRECSQAVQWGPFRDAVCKTCDAIFQKRLYDHEDAVGFCSAKCMGKKNRERIEIKCTICDSSIMIQQSRLGKTKFCSRECASFSHRGPKYREKQPHEKYKLISKNNKPVAEHRFVMQQMIGRPLAKNENVHHKNGLRKDNRPSNLELWHVGQPFGQRVDDKAAWCIEFLSQYPEIADKLGYELKKKSHLRLVESIDLMGLVA